MDPQVAVWNRRSYVFRLLRQGGAWQYYQCEYNSKAKRWALHASTPSLLSTLTLFYTQKMTRSSRRHFLQAASALCAATALPGAQRTAPHLQFPKEPRDRLAVTSYPFRAFIDSPTNSGRDKRKPGMDLKDFPAMIAKRFSVFNINPLGSHMSSTDSAYLDAFRKAVESASSHLVDLGLRGKDFSNTDKAVREEAVAYGRKWIDIAAILGAPSVRQHLEATQHGTPSVENSVESLGRLADYGAGKNIVVNLENDSPGAEDPFFLISVLAKVDHPYLRALPDFGNSLRGHDAEYNRKAVGGMFKYACNMSHVKDVLAGKDGETYRVDVPGMFAVARENSYRGYFSMEFDTSEGDPFQGTESLVKQSLKFMAS